MTAALFGLISALSWGIGDFAGGLSSRKVGAYRTLMYGEAIGLVFAFMLLPFLQEPFPDSHTIKWSIAAGLVGTIGLLAFFEGMRDGQISIVAPFAALIGAIIPVIVGSFIEGLPPSSMFWAFGLAFIAVVLISLEKDGDESKAKTRLFLPLLAGTSFGFYFVFMNEASHDLVMGPLIIARSTGMISVAIYLLLKRETFRIQPGSWRWISVNGVFDVGGNLFYILATQAGRLDVAAVISSLYPGMTVFLAWLILKERLQITQWIGILIALIAIILIATA